MTRFAYDGQALIAEYDGSNVPQRRYVQGPGADEPLVWYEGSGTSDRRWLHADERGSINGIERRMLVDSGATMTVLSQKTAELASVERSSGLLPVRMRTANGVIPAEPEWSNAFASAVSKSESSKWSSRRRSAISTCLE